MPNDILGSGEYEICIYSGVKPATLKEKSEGRLLSKGPVGKANPIITSGMASYFIVSKNGQAVYMGNIGTSGCALVVPNINFIEDGFFTVDSFPAGYND